MLEGRPLAESLKAGKSGALGFLEEKVGLGSSGVKVGVDAKLAGSTYDETGLGSSARLSVHATALGS